MKTIIIAGMHRSGTSLITQWLHKCGLQVGAYCLGANPTNPDGHFEDLEFVRLHEDVLKDNELPDTGLTEHPIRYISDYNRQRFEDLFKLKNDFFAQWGWKDPRSCMFLKYYKNNFPECNYLFVFRDFRSVVTSLLAREFGEVDKKYLSRSWPSRYIWNKFRRPKRLELFYSEKATDCLKVWISYNQQILNTIQSLGTQKYIILSYSLLLQEDRQVFKHLSEQWGLDLHYLPFRDVFKSKLINPPATIDSYIDEALLMRAKELENQLQLKLLLQGLNIFVG